MAGLQPGALTVNEYVLVIVGIAVTTADADEIRFGPVQEYPVVPPPGTAVSVTVPTLHIGPLLETVAVGLFTVTVVV